MLLLKNRVDLAELGAARTAAGVAQTPELSPPATPDGSELNWGGANNKLMDGNINMVPCQAAPLILPGQRGGGPGKGEGRLAPYQQLGTVESARRSC